MDVCHHLGRLIANCYWLWKGRKLRKGGWIQGSLSKKKMLKSSSVEEKKEKKKAVNTGMIE